MSAQGREPTGSGDGFIGIMGHLRRLKTLRRTGWVRSGVLDTIPPPSCTTSTSVSSSRVESVAEHMHRTALLAMLLSDDGNVAVDWNKDKLVKMCLVHDVAESIVGDITPHDNVAESDKVSRESHAFDAMCASFAAMGHARDLWREFEEGTSPEAKIAKQLDKLEMIVQAAEYEREQPHLDLSQFFDSTRTVFTHPQIQLWAAQAEASRPRNNTLTPPQPPNINNP